MSHGNLIQLTAKIYDARDAMRSLYGDGYGNQVGEYQKFIRAAVNKYQLDPLRATMKLVGILQDKEPGSSINQALLLAAYVEMVEHGNP